MTAFAVLRLKFPSGFSTLSCTHNNQEFHMTTQNYKIRLIEQQDNAGIAAVIREVSAEHGLTADKGFAVADPILDTLFEVYSKPRSAYWVVEMDGKNCWRWRCFTSRGRR